MSKRSDFQESFASALLDPGLQPPETVQAAAAQTSQHRFNIYRNNVVSGITGALRATYPAVDKLVGREFFNAAARAYMKTELPRSPLLFQYGGTFGSFLETFPPAASVPYLGDIARLEWARLEAFHAANCAPLKIDSLGELSESEISRVRFALHPSLALIQSSWPVVSLWAASVGLGTSEDVNMKRSEQAIVIRPDMTVNTQSIPRDSLIFIAELQAGGILEQAAGKAAAVSEGFDLAANIHSLFALGCVTGLDVADTP